jgi:hypothetical protein
MGRDVPARDAATLTGSIKSKIMDIFKERLADWGKGNWQLFNNPTEISVVSRSSGNP